MTINSAAELVQVLQSHSLTATWQVKSDIGPGWIGGGRKVTLLVDDEELTDSPFYQQLLEKLIEAVPIPVDGGDYMIEGEGTFKIEGTALVMEYDTESTIPYDWNFKDDSGKVTVLENL